MYHYLDKSVGSQSAPTMNAIGPYDRDPQTCLDCPPIPPVSSSSSSSTSARPSPSNPGSSHTPPPSTIAAQSHPPSTSAPDDIRPPAALKPSITIEFCDRCRWCVAFLLSSSPGSCESRRLGSSKLVHCHRAPRATWIQTELFLTFPNPALRAITLQPLNAPETGGRFRVWLDSGEGDELVWDRKVSPYVEFPFAS